MQGKLLRDASCSIGPYVEGAAVSGEAGMVAGVVAV